MTRYVNVEQVRVDFTNRDGVATSLIVSPPDGEASAVLTVSDDGMSCSFEVNAELDNSPRHYRFVDNEGPVPPVAPVAKVASKPELGPVGRWSMGIVSLAILAPFIAILWAWAGSVFRGMQ